MVKVPSCRVCALAQRAMGLELEIQLQEVGNNPKLDVPAGAPGPGGSTAALSFELAPSHLSRAPGVESLIVTPPISLRSLSEPSIEAFGFPCLLASDPGLGSQVWTASSYRSGYCPASM